jgi:hypothetical protein
LLSRLFTDDAKVREQLFQLVKSQDEEIRDRARWALANSDPRGADPKVLEEILKLVRSSDAEDVKSGIRMLSYSPLLPGGQEFARPRLRRAAAVVPHAFHPDESVKQTAREALVLLERDEAPAVVADVMKRLKEAEDAPTKLAAIRALAAIGPLAAEAESLLKEMMPGDDLKLATAAAVAINRMHPEASSPPGTETLLSYPDKATSIDQNALEREGRQLFPQHGDLDGRGGRGGGFY